ncbi:MAG: hypothetical protein ACD_47C00360G0002 [uncultured bacterium]|uniref:Uncharacterized protein n=1 Tax=Candidatus Wallbacteria bacterium GWC2_49_35 TaxID=1817813 RepID=A0A1F7WFC4_9BACT|nr:MAG: hypothetical protein ACD_47C00360G0002 [uncultured bacterium]OGM01532.1 MAG: hypothetical protein A2008_00210 [Candidatus Wallbacteria bacterium GWC2_49_35]HBC73315.1 hypothetical protein [Candidatus Wallbacteria bacterium]
MTIFQQNEGRRSERYCVRPSIIIGLGGTGTEICLKLKKLLAEKAGNDFPLVKFLIFDTDVMDIMGVKTNAASETVAHNQIKSTFTPNEFYHLTVRDVEGIIKNAEKHPHIFSWFPKNLELKDISNGANQVRIIGRLALYWNISQVIDAIGRVKKEVSSIKNKTAASERGYDVQEGLSVYIMSSLCGGSGSGMFLDMGYIVQNLIENCEINSYSVMPSIFQIEQQSSIDANAYAALKELDYLMSEQNFTLDMGPQYEPRTFKTRPFDRCYLIDSWTESSLHIEGVDCLSEIAANVAFYDFMTVAGKRHRSVIDNVKYKLGNKICERSSAYSSFGLSSVFFDGAKVKKSCAAILAEEFSSKFIKICDKKSVKNSVNEFVRLNKLNEEVTDDVITYMRSDGRAPVKIFKNPSEFDVFSMDQMLAEIQKWYSEIKNIYMPEKYKLMDQNLEKLSAAVVKNIEKEIENILSGRELGINYAEQFLSSLDISLRAFSDMLAAEAQKIRDQKKQLMIAIKVNKVTELLGSFLSYIIYRSKITEARDELIYEMVKDVNFDIEIYIRELAISFYNRVCARISEISAAQVGSLKNFIGACEKEFEKKARELLNPRSNAEILTEKRIKGSAADVQKIYEKYCPENIDEVINKFLSTVSGPVNMWNISKKEEMSSKIFEYCQSFFAPIDDVSLLRLIVDDGSAPDVIDDLMRSAAPMWSYSTVEMPSGTQIDEIAIVSIIEECRAEFTKYLRDQNKAVFNPSIDNHKISVMRFRHGLPLFALPSLKRDLKPAYEMFKTGASPNTPVKPLHIDEKYADLPEIVLS